MNRSAELLDLQLPPLPALADLANVACQAWESSDEAALRLVCTRGRESGGPPTVFATVKPLPSSMRSARQQGVAVRTAGLGVAARSRVRTPWLLSGAKTLSYAVNMATLRWGVSGGVDDVLWVSTDGYALEAPTATLVWLDGDVLCTVPPDQTGILAGTTAAWLFEHADSLGWRTDLRMVRPTDLLAADGAWLTSSVRGIAAIRSLDGAALAQPPVTTRLLDLLGFER